MGAPPPEPMGAALSVGAGASRVAKQRRGTDERELPSSFPASSDSSFVLIR